jgi:hypothetical protein
MTAIVKVKTKKKVGRDSRSNTPVYSLIFSEGLLIYRSSELSVKETPFFFYPTGLALDIQSRGGPRKYQMLHIKLEPKPRNIGKP